LLPSAHYEMMASQSGKSFRFTILHLRLLDDNPTAHFSANTITAATMQEIVPNTRSGRALWAVKTPMMPAILRMRSHQLSGQIRDKYDRPQQVSSSGSLSARLPFGM
jgi:hypothetical protein